MTMTHQFDSGGSKISQTEVPIKSMCFFAGTCMHRDRERSQGNRSMLMYASVCYIVLFFALFQGISGLFTSPNYPRNYPNDAECTWTILGGHGKVITVSFLDFYLQYDLSCDYDSLRAYEGRGTYGKRIFK